MGMLAIPGFDLGYSGAGTRTSNNGAPTALLIFVPSGCTMTITNYNYSGYMPGMQLFIRSWNAGTINASLTSGWNGNTIITPGNLGWNGTSFGSTTWEQVPGFTPFAGGAGQVYSIIAQNLSGVQNFNANITVNPATPQPQPTLNTPTSINATFNSVDNQGGNISVTITITEDLSR